jgi:hypothetical protein
MCLVLKLDFCSYASWSKIWYVLPCELVEVAYVVSICAFAARCAGMYKNQLQELAQRSCFNLPSYACVREGPDHAPRFKATVNFNGEMFESPTFCSTLRQAEHAAAEVALNELSKRGLSSSLAAKVLVSFVGSPGNKIS